MSAARRALDSLQSFNVDLVSVAAGTLTVRRTFSTTSFSSALLDITCSR
ncbi:hypothetical protein ACSVBT_00765 [Afipia sp. TerB]